MMLTAELVTMRMWLTFATTCSAISSLLLVVSTSRPGISFCNGKIISFMNLSVSLLAPLTLPFRLHRDWGQPSACDTRWRRKRWRWAQWPWCCLSWRRVTTWQSVTRDTWHEKRKVRERSMSHQDFLFFFCILYLYTLTLRLFCKCFINVARIVTYYVGHSSCGLWGLVWSDLINLNYVICIGSQRYHFLWSYN